MGHDTIADVYLVLPAIAGWGILYRLVILSVFYAKESEN